MHENLNPFSENPFQDSFVPNRQEDQHRKKATKTLQVWLINEQRIPTVDD